LIFSILLTYLVKIQILWNVQIHLVLKLIPIIHDDVVKWLFSLVSDDFNNFPFFANAYKNWPIVCVRKESYDSNCFRKICFCFLFVSFLNICDWLGNFSVLWRTSALIDNDKTLLTN
jgi:hypothetical protein